MPKPDASFLDALRSDDDDGRPCDLSRAFGRMDPQFALEVRSAMANSDWSGAKISRTLQRFGFDVSEGAVRRCRRTCDCWKEN